MDRVQSPNHLVRNGDEITEMKQGEQTAKLQSHENDYESEFINYLVNRNRDDPVQSCSYLFTRSREDPVQSSGEEISEEESDKITQEESDDAGNEEGYAHYWPLYKAVQEDDWNGIVDFITKYPEALTAKIKVHEEETVLHIISRNLAAPSWLLEKLVSMVSSKSLKQLKDEFGESVIFQAAKHGNTKAARVFVRWNKDLPNIRNRRGYLPIHLATEHGHKEIIQYLLSVTRTPLDDEKGVEMLQDLIKSGLYGIALDFLKRYPKLARERNEEREDILKILANKPLAFESGGRLGYWKCLIYKLIPVQEQQILHPETVHWVDDKGTKATLFGSLCQILHMMLWNVLMRLVPSIKGIRDTKIQHRQTLEIAKLMCHGRIIESHKEAMDIFLSPILTAARLGIHELVKEILKAYFYSFTFYRTSDDNDIFRTSILYRQKEVFRLLSKRNMLLSWDWDMTTGADIIKRKDNLLHLAGRYQPSSRVAGAALQMQRELQWFQAVESFVHPSLGEQRNKKHKTPREVFTEEHKDLVKEGEKWMKDTASSYSFVAALIITVVFAAAFTVPGGNNGGGIPIFLYDPSFLVFAVSDALALFSSTASLLMFLAILTSRYSEEDFLEALPKKLIIGLISMFFSIASMMVAFGATIYIFLSRPWKWVIIPISLLGCVPVTLFALLQFPLLVEIFSSTYGPGILQPTK